MNNKKYKKKVEHQIWDKESEGHWKLGKRYKKLSEMPLEIINNNNRDYMIIREETNFRNLNSNLRSHQYVFIKISELYERSINANLLQGSIKPEFERCENDKIILKKHQFITIHEVFRSNESWQLIFDIDGPANHLFYYDDLGYLILIIKMVKKLFNNLVPDDLNLILEYTSILTHSKMDSSCKQSFRIIFPIIVNQRTNNIIYELIKKFIETNSGSNAVEKFFKYIDLGFVRRDGKTFTMRTFQSQKYVNGKHQDVCVISSESGSRFVQNRFCPVRLFDITCQIYETPKNKNDKWVSSYCKKFNNYALCYSHINTSTYNAFAQCDVTMGNFENPCLHKVEPVVSENLFSNSEEEWAKTNAIDILFKEFGQKIEFIGDGLKCRYIRGSTSNCPTCERIHEGNSDGIGRPCILSLNKSKEFFILSCSGTPNPKNPEELKKIREKRIKIRNPLKHLEIVPKFEQKTIIRKQVNNVSLKQCPLPKPEFGNNLENTEIKKLEIVKYEAIARFGKNRFGTNLDLETKCEISDSIIQSELENKFSETLELWKKPLENKFSEDSLPKSTQWSFDRFDDFKSYFEKEEIGDKTHARYILTYLQEIGVLKPSDGKDKSYFIFNSKNKLWEEKTKGFVAEIISDFYKPLYLAWSNSIPNDELNKGYKNYLYGLSKSWLNTLPHKILESYLDSYLYEPNFDSKTNKRHDLLPVKNGCINLRTGKLEEMKKEYYFTNSIEIEYDENAKCDLFKKSMEEIHPNAETLEFILDYLGYSLTGENNLKMLVFLCGKGCNGKSLIQHTMGHLLGQFCKTFSKEAIKPSSGNCDELYYASFARFACIPDCEGGKSVNWGLIKQLTGSDKISISAKYKRNIEFIPLFKMLISCNDPPIVSGKFDSALWKRIRLVNYPISFKNRNDIEWSDEEYKNGTMKEVNKNLFSELIKPSELQGILALLVKHAKKYYEIGDINVPESITSSTTEYKDENDVYGMYIKLRLEPLSDEEKKINQKWTTFKAIAADFKQTNNFDANSKSFGTRLTSLICKKKDEKKYIKFNGVTEMSYAVKFKS